MEQIADQSFPVYSSAVGSIRIAQMNDFLNTNQEQQGSLSTTLLLYLVET